MSPAKVNASNKSKLGLTSSVGLFVWIALTVHAGGAHAATSVTRVDAFDYETATGLPIKQIVEPGDSNLCSSSVYGYDPYGNKKSVTVSNCAGLAGTYAGSSTAINSEAAAPGAGSSAPFTQRASTSVYTYNSDGTVTVVSTNAENESETRVYGAEFGQLLSLKGPNNLVTQWAYDGLRRKTLELRPDGNGTTWTYQFCTGINGGSATCPATLNTGSNQQVTAYPAYVITQQPVAGPINISAQTVGSPNGAYTKIYYDILNRPIRTETQGFDKSVDGQTSIQTTIYQDTTYDSLGRVATTSRPYYSTDKAYVTQNQYDNWGRVILATAADTSKTSTTYNGLSISVVNDLNQATTKTRNEIGQVIQTTDNNNKTLTLAYDAFGDLLQSTDSAGNAVKMQYDSRGRKYAMQDPDMGSWTYSYNAVGDMVTQTDAKSQKTTFQYDRVGRLVAKAEPNLNTNWYYTNNADGSACSMGRGKLCEATANNGYDRKHTYDSIGRVSTIAIKASASATPYTQGWAYDSNGRVLGATYPSGFVTQNIYTPLGYMWKLVDNAASPSLAYWRVQAMDAEQHLTQQVYGNNVQTTNSYYANTGRLQTTVASGGLQNISYTYDTLGNLKTRNDAVTTVAASYGYDGINRLQSETLSGGGLSAQQVINWTYDTAGIGNMQSRSDVGTYAYNPSGANSVRPHAVTGVTGTVDGLINPSYSYDNNGNLLTVTATGGSRAVGWTSYNMVSSVSQTVGGTTNALGFVYGPEHDRVQETYTKNNVLQRTIIYLNTVGGEGLLYEEELNNLTNVVTKKHYLNAGDGTIGVLSYTGTAYSGTQYWHKDHMGSTMVISDATGALVERLAYEPFGKRRNANGTTDAAGTLTSVNTKRGYTEQEMMDEVGLINMNGRVYDPAISRFLSPDPTVQAPTYLQAYNRYSYTVNNPLKYFDPTGFEFEDVDYSAFMSDSFSSQTVSDFTSSDNTQSEYGTLLFNVNNADIIMLNNTSNGVGNTSGSSYSSLYGSSNSNSNDLGIVAPAQPSQTVGARNPSTSVLVSEPQTITNLANVDGGEQSANNATFGMNGVQVAGADVPVLISLPTLPTLVRGAVIVFDVLTAPVTAAASLIVVPGNTPVNDQIYGPRADPKYGPIYNQAEQGADKPSVLTPGEETHILDGDKDGGGHAPGTGKPGKSEYPSGWSRGKIVGEVSDVLTDPGSTSKPGRDGTTIIEGTRDGVRIRVVRGSDGSILTGIPLSGPGVKQNPR